ncbi:rRNA N6-adenosine-methyltransferase ZCCHC4 isoform X3 [Stegostoma tigrinum]|uniref:rRNA N6-adenosine-methyltransferase ZCCHC4 isoform X3 n=1 Tax=Stegostoma tigrinum TaxID=3053191 RepID=UPI00202B826E|nr:rRNA N6-adenosine-methyltransferase ZCCHC4 isoform X3 [Stegostoma tigrinum]
MHSHSLSLTHSHSHRPDNIREEAVLESICPTLLFVKVTRKKRESRRFYACAACRDRKDCNFFQWEDEKVSEARQLAREELNRRRQPQFTHQQYVERYQRFVSLPLANRTFCTDCQILLLPEDLDQHSTHDQLGHVALCQLKRPSLLLLPLENKKTNAQYLFADRTCQFLLDLIASLGFRRVLCVGTPRLHELIRVRQSENKEPFIRSQLLDIDFRYSQFYSEEEFCHYNMFNHYFFGGKPDFETFRTFLCQNKGESVVMVTDPPFGGLVEALAHSFKKIVGEWKTSRNKIDEELPIFWIFPYFFEPRIRRFFPTLNMLDYQATELRQPSKLGFGNLIHFFLRWIMIIMHCINMEKQDVNSLQFAYLPTFLLKISLCLQKKGTGFVHFVKDMYPQQTDTVRFARPAHLKMVDNGNTVRRATNV